jgi:acetylglutamate kinase
MKDDGRLSDGMLPKAEAIEHALKEGVARVHIISYHVPDSLLIEVFTNDGTGTLIINDVAALSSVEQ